MSSINEEIKKQEAKRMLKIANKVGYFDVAVSDEALEVAFAQLVETARTAPA